MIARVLLRFDCHKRVSLGPAPAWKRQEFVDILARFLCWWASHHDEDSASNFISCDSASMGLEHSARVLG